MTTTFDPHEFGGRLRAWREDRGMSQRAVAERLGVSQAIIARYEAGDRIPRAARLLALDAMTGGALLEGRRRRS